MKALVDLEAVEAAPKAVRTMGSKSENIKMPKGLLQRRLVRILERDELLRVGMKEQGRPLLNGRLGVSKGAGLE
eukprot:3658226-Karenia_brevis.AAC.1